MTKHDDDDDDRPRFMPLGDIGTIFLAGVFLLGMLYMMFGPSPFAGIHWKTAEPKEQRGVVDVTVPPKE